MTKKIDPAKTIFDYGFPQICLTSPFAPWHALLLAVKEREIGTLIGGVDGVGTPTIRDDDDFDWLITAAADDYNAKIFSKIVLKRTMAYHDFGYGIVDQKLDEICRYYAKENTIDGNEPPTNWASLQDILDDEIGDTALPAQFEPKILSPHFIARFCYERYRVLTRLRYATPRYQLHQSDIHCKADSVYAETSEWKQTEAAAKSEMYFGDPVEGYFADITSIVAVARRSAIDGYEYAAIETNVTKEAMINTSDLNGVTYHLYLNLSAPVDGTFHSFGNGGISEGWNHLALTNKSTFWRLSLADVRNAPTSYDERGYSYTGIQQDGLSFYADLKNRFRFCPVK